MLDGLVSSFPGSMQFFQNAFGLNEALSPTEKLGCGWVETTPSNICKHLYLTSAKAVGVVP
jgi:hypothetical protein